jgi:hypothetical protein
MVGRTDHVSMNVWLHTINYIVLYTYITMVGVHSTYNWECTERTCEDSLAKYHGFPSLSSQLIDDWTILNTMQLYDTKIQLIYDWITIYYMIDYYTIK